MYGKQIPKPVPGRLDVPGITEAFAHRMMYPVAKDQYTARDFDAYQGLVRGARRDRRSNPGLIVRPPAGSGNAPSW